MSEEIRVSRSRRRSRPVDAACGEAGEKAGHDGARVARDRHLRGKVRTENPGIDVHVDEVLGNPAAEAARGNLGEPGADREQAIAVHEGVLGRRHRRPGETHARVEGMGCRKRGKALKRRRDRRPEELGDTGHVIGDVDGAPAHEEAGEARLLEEVDRSFEKTLLGLCGRRGRLEDGQLLDRLLEELQVHGDLDEDRAGDAGHGRSIRVEDRGHDFGVRRGAPRPLRQALQDRVLVELVKLVAEGDVGADAARDHEHGDPVQEGFADAAHGMGDPRGRHDHERSDRAAARSADSVGREGRARLVRDEDGLDLLRLVELVVDLRVVHAGNPERVRHGKLLQGVPHEPGAGPLSADPDRLRHTDAPAIVRAATRPVRTQLPRNVPSREPMPWIPPPPKPAASPTA